ncbi:MAG: chorismate synthase [Clostridiales Family XIII bacterium]|jgi:chorismate synthase|nr:chorismate synthase [Clostridiales Family XIII bacterium]
MNTFGNLFRVTIFGESHGPAVGCVVDGVPAGTKIDEAEIAAELERRAPGRSGTATPRRETDIPEILSGVRGGIATGAPIACLIRNENAHSGDYAEIPLRPGHADWTALVKYGGHADPRGGGRFSGRLTAGLVFAGAIAKKLLAGKGVSIYARLKSVAGAEDAIDLASGGASARKEALRQISLKPFPAADDCEELFKARILAAKDAGDSVGGIVEAVCFGVPAGTGEPFFGSVESRAAAMLFSVPAVKGVEFGRGFEIAKLRGSEANDPIMPAGGKRSFATTTNNNGGLLGGIANGMPIVCRAAVKPTASIAMAQDSVDPIMGEAARIELKGRHDPCIAPRAVPVVEAGLAIVLADLLLEGGYL